MFDFYGINKPGKGVDKRDPNQPRFSLYLELLTGKFWQLIKVNLLYMLLSIPTFIITMLIAGIITSGFTDSVAATILQNGETIGSQNIVALWGMDLSVRAFVSLTFLVFLGMGPVTAGITYVIKNYATETHVWLLSDAWKNIKANFKQAILLWIIDITVFTIIIISLAFYAKMGAIGVVAICILTSFSLLYMMAHVYIYQIMVSFELSFKDLVKNAVIMAGITAPKTLLLLLVQTVIHILLPLAMIISGAATLGMTDYFVLEVLFLPTFTAFTNNFFINNSIKKYLIDSNDNN